MRRPLVQAALPAADRPRRWPSARSSLRVRFVLGVAVMLLPLVNLAAAAWFSVTRLDHAAREVAAGATAPGADPLATITAVRQEALVAVIGVCVAGVVVAAVAGRLLARSVLEPLSTIREATRVLGAGDLAHRVGLARGDELGAVADAFDAMAERLQHSQDDLVHQAAHDPLTGLGNRRLLHERLRRGVHPSSSWALLLIDLDGFKVVNDSLGHVVGDQALVVVAGRLATAVGDDGVCTRLGGDEFAVLLSGVTSPAQAVERGHRLRQVIQRPVLVGGRDVVLDASIGVVPETTGTDPDVVLRNADLAMYAAKRAGGGRVELYATPLHQQAVARLELEDELRQAVCNGQLRPHYQPVVDLHSGRVVGAEALVRWHHPRRGVVYPADFIPLAEESDLIIAVGEQVLLNACTEVAAWLRERPWTAPFTLSVNVSARQLEHPELARTVHRVLAVSGLAADRLTLEITETVMMGDPQASLERLQALAALGVRLAVDDFGTGYSSLSYLQRFPVTSLKMDTSFIAPLDSDPNAVLLAGAVLRLAETLGLRVVAEGVERPAQADVLRGLGCQVVQGYLFGRPGPLAALDEAALEDAARPRSGGSPQPHF